MFMKFSKSIGTVSFHLGYTNIEANSWNISSSSIKPGTTSLLDKLSSGLKQWFGVMVSF